MCGPCGPTAGWWALIYLFVEPVKIPGWNTSKHRGNDAGVVPRPADESTGGNSLLTSAIRGHARKTCTQLTSGDSSGAAEARSMTSAS